MRARAPNCRLERYLLPAAIWILLPFLGGCGMGLPSGEGVARLNGVEIRHFVAGSGPVVVVHPGGPGFGWEYMRMPRLESVATVVYFDPRGAGGSTRPSGPGAYRIERMVEDLEGLRLHLDLDRMALLGHSHGGLVAQLYALRHPDRLSSLILACTAPHMGPEWAAAVNRNLSKRSYERWYPAAMAALDALGTEETEEELRKHLKQVMPFYFHRWDRFGDGMLKRLDRLPVSREPLRAFAEEEAHRIDLRDRLSGLRVRTLVLGGRHDPTCPTECAANLHRLIPGSRISVFEQSGHFPFIEEEEAFALVVGAFLIAG